MSKKQLIVGRFNQAGKFVTKDGVKEVVLLPEASDEHTDHFLSDEAKAENFAVLKGIEGAETITEASIVNVLESIPSQLLSALLESKEGEKDEDRAKRVKSLSDRVIDELPAILGIDLEEEEPFTEETVDVIPLKKHLCAIVVGHSEADKGAQSPYFEKTQEWDYNSLIASLIQDKVSTVDVEIIFRTKGYNALPGMVNAKNPDFVVSLHCNSATPSARGTEMIYCPGSTQGHKLGTFLYEEVCDLYDRTGSHRRGVITPRKGRGMTLLRGTAAPAVITEPFFLSNKDDMWLGLDKIEELADAYVRGIEAYAASLASAVRDATPDAAPNLKHRGLSKKQFLADNQALLEEMIKSSNGWAQEVFGNDSIGLTSADLYLIGNGEMGLHRGGSVNAHYVHSAKEVGLFPLPQNLSYWLDTKNTGRNTPAWNKAHDLDENVQAFLDYLVSLKNKKVKTASGIELYRELFRMDGVKGNDLIEAGMLAAVVHGYFYSGVYSDKNVPITSIAEGIRDGDSITSIMAGTTYKYAGSNILKNREKNMNQALAWLNDSGSAMA